MDQKFLAGQEEVYRDYTRIRPPSTADQTKGTAASPPVQEGKDWCIKVRKTGGCDCCLQPRAQGLNTTGTFLFIVKVMM